MAQEDAENDVYNVYREEGVRLDEELDPKLYEHMYASDKVQELSSGLHAFDKAHGVMLVEQGVIDEEDGIAILEGLREMEDRGVLETRASLGGHLHTGEAFLTEMLSEDIAGKLHTGRSSGDLSKVAGRWVARERLLTTLTALNNLREALIEKAAEHVDTVMPGYTHMQHAQPTTFGHYLMSFENAYERDFTRLKNAYDHANVSPAGAAILTGSRYNINRERTRELLGFDEKHTNTMDAIFNGDWGLETHSTLMTLYSTVTKMAEDFTLFSTQEYNLIDQPDQFCGTSSIMPQKKNPYLTQLAVESSGKIYGDSVHGFVGSKGSHGRLEVMTSGYDNLWESFDILEAILEMFDGFIEDIEVHEDVMETRASEHWAQATDLADSMVIQRNLPFRTAHQITAVLVRMCEEQAITPDEIDATHVDAAAKQVIGESLELEPHLIRDALDPKACVEKRKLPGGPSRERMHEDLDRARNQLEVDEETVSGLRSDQRNAAEKLDAAIDEIIH